MTYQNFYLFYITKYQDSEALFFNISIENTYFSIIFITILNPLSHDFITRLVSDISGQSATSDYLKLHHL